MFSTELRALSPDQERLLIDLKEQWAARCAHPGPADRPAAQAAIERIHEHAYLKPPTRWVWVDSPLEGAAVAHLLAGVRRSSAPLIQHGLGLMMERLEHLVREQISTRVDLAPQGADAGQLFAFLQRAALLDLEGDPGLAVQERVRPRVEEVLGRTVTPRPSRGRDQSRALMPTGLGSLDRRLATRFDFYGRLGIMGAQDDAWLAIVRSAGWWWAFEDLCVLSSPPVRLAFDPQGRLHDATGRALEYPDGWGFHMWHGVRVSEEVILAPETLDAQEILREGNVEARRVMLERFGMERLIEAARAQVVDQDEGRTLYRIPQSIDEPIVVVKVRCPTTDRVYYLRVPPATATCAAAVAWSCGMEDKDYRPVTQT